jgi:arylformamidase
MTKLIDLTLPLSNHLPVYPGDPRFELAPLERIEAGAGSNTSLIKMGTHAGTHVDAPRHCQDNGQTVDALPLDILIGKARVIDLAVGEQIERADLEARDLRDDIRVLLRTHPSGHGRGEGDGPHLSVEAARYLAQAGIKLVGIDAWSVDAKGSADLPAHRALLSAGVILVEGLNLQEAEEGEYEMFCLPLCIAGGDGAPARVVLRKRMT